MSYEADLTAAHGSTDLEYTDVHGVCDIAHSGSLLMVLSAGGSDQSTRSAGRSV
jgi:hypothetical protein